MKAIISLEEAKQKLLELYQAKNPDITEIVIEADKKDIISRGTGSIVQPASTILGPNDPKMIELVRSLQLVADDGRNLTLKFLKGKNKGMTFELTKGLETVCQYCGYIAMSDPDIREHEQTYHKDILEILKQREKAQLEKATTEKRKKIVAHDKERGDWRQRRDS